MANLTQHINVLSVNVANSANIQPETATAICKELHTISVAMDLQKRMTEQNLLAVVHERDQIRASVLDSQRLLSNALAERDRACQERDRVLTMHSAGYGNGLVNKEVFDRVMQSETELRAINTELKATIKRMDGQITAMEQQLEGKRSLWMRNHPQPATNSLALNARASVSGADMNHNTDASDAEEEDEDNDDVCSIQSFALMESTPDKAEFNSPPGSGQSRTHEFMPFDAVRVEFTTDISAVWNACEALATRFFNVPNPMSLDSKLAQQPEIWHFILTLTYPIPADAAAHTITLLRSPLTRRFFVMRMCISFLISRLWTYAQWKDHSADTAKLIDFQMARLKDTSLTQAERAATIAVLTNRVISITSSPGYSVYRLHKLSVFTKGLRQLLGPILNANAGRAEAGHAISDLITKAYDTTAKMHTSFWQFQATFPATGSKFLTHNMHCKNLAGGDTEQALESRQTKITLCASPVVIIRDDRGVAIRVKQILNAEIVLAP